MNSTLELDPGDDPGINNVTNYNLAERGTAKITHTPYKQETKKPADRPRNPISTFQKYKVPHKKM